MTVQPAPKTQELENNIDYFFNNCLRPTPLEILRLKKEAENLINIDAATAYSYLGFIAVLENNRKAVISNYEKAMKLTPNDCAIHSNYSIALLRCGLTDLALEEERKVFSKFPNNKDILLDLFYDFINSARFDEAHKLSSEIEDNEGIELVNNATKIFKEVDLTDDEAQHLQKLAYSLIKKNNIYHFSSIISIIDNCVSFTIYVDLPIEEIFDINWELAGVLADNVEDMRCGVLNFEYSSIEVLRERREYERSL
jgi:tetratricopeptide (TPR) repeat protein